MKSYFTLSFQDPKDNEDCNRKRLKEIYKISLLLFLQRILFFIILLINYFIEGTTVDRRRLWLNSIGVGVHLLLLIPLHLKKIGFWEYVHAPLLIVTFQTYVFNDDTISAENTSKVVSYIC